MSLFDDHIATTLKELDGEKPSYTRGEINSLAAKAGVEITLYRREAVDGEEVVEGEVNWGEVSRVYLEGGGVWITLYLEGGEVVRGSEENSSGKVTEWAYGWGW